MMLEQLARGWGTFTDERLLRQIIYMHCNPYASKEEVELIRKMVRERNLPTHSMAKIQLERHNAMQIHYVKDEEYQARMFKVLYPENTCPKCGGKTYRESGWCETCENTFLGPIVFELVNMGFCQQKFYTKTAWKYAMQMMDLALYLKLARPHDFGRGLGKFTTDSSIKEVAEFMKKDLRAIAIARAYYKFKTR